MSGKKRGLSFDDKRARILEVFHESSDVFVLKEVEKLSVKKGVTIQSVKEVLQSLVDDDYVNQEKIGTTNFLWSFPSEKSVKLEKQLKEASARLEEAKRQKTQLAAEIDQLQTQRPDLEEAQERLAELEALREQKASKEALVARLRGSDSVVAEAVVEAIPSARDSANRWLDNANNLKDWTKRRFPGMEREIEGFFEENGLTDEVDYLD
uniref:Meiotic nuclear division protein 1 homolog n=1 Tax=Tetraselmis sp. GSL018 TaxID=582737 RepID=A0A061RK68_9CHLO|mmetsp:Transcript_40956/g.97319  ORF Transcript_40956/g.97319 Transcript_40956/m.97319 type:complete len:209 (+) Transcript_40956:459-1085(+)